MRCDEGEFPGLVSKLENVSDKEMVRCLLGQAILQIGGKIAWKSGCYFLAGGNFAHLVMAVSKRRSALARNLVAKSTCSWVGDTPVFSIRAAAATMCSAAAAAKCVLLNETKTAGVWFIEFREPFLR